MAGKNNTPKPAFACYCGPALQLKGAGIWDAGYGLYVHVHVVRSTRGGGGGSSTSGCCGAALCSVWHDGAVICRQIADRIHRSQPLKALRGPCGPMPSM
jgi:hypothetical protein